MMKATLIAIITYTAYHKSFIGKVSEHDISSSHALVLATSSGNMSTDMTESVSEKTTTAFGKYAWL